MPAFSGTTSGSGTSDDVAGLVAYLASDAAAGVTGQALGVGDRLQLWSHPEPVVTAYREGGWTFDALTTDFDAEFGGDQSCRRAPRSRRASATRRERA